MLWMEIIIVVLLLIITVFQILNYIKLSKQNIDQTETNIIQKLESINSELDNNIENEFKRNREETLQNSKLVREEVGNSVRSLGDQLSNRIRDISDRQKDQLDIVENRLKNLTQTNEEKFDKLNNQVSKQLSEIQDKNEKKLEEMRVTVDEKLHTTLEKRLGESFNVVSSQLKSVYEGLGDMQKLASGVGDLKRVLTNVKSRGTWGEVQLGALIEQVLTIDQYAKNVKIKSDSNEIVEFAIKMPGQNSDEIVWIPIDAKFPMEDYQRLQDAQDSANPILIEEVRKSLENNIKKEAKRIQEKYVDPPNTTDFAIMFLPIEGLYAEVLRIPGLFDFVQREYRVNLTGPTNFLAVLNSLQMGFRTLAIQQRSSEVWKVLGSVKSEFGKFGELLDKTHKKLQEASNSIDTASKKSKTIERRLRDVQELPTSENQMDLIE
ncbi:MAG: DNA recombination protein RmuC [Ignavibacteriae bacterium]|nr:DNA recombination protein RmuC [Ignavibacteriota bacterium]